MNEDMSFFEQDRVKDESMDENDCVNITLGIGLEWERGVVTGIVIRHVFFQMNPDTFLNLVMFSKREEEHVQVTGIVLTAYEAKAIQNSIPEDRMNHMRIKTTSILVHNRGIKSCLVPDQAVSDMTTHMVSLSCSHCEKNLPTANKSDSYRHVHFSDTVSVVLVPVLSIRSSDRERDGSSNCFYTPQDYQRFSRQRDLELEDAMRDEGLEQEEALQSMFFLKESLCDLQTHNNYIVSVDDVERVISIDGMDEHVGHVPIEDVRKPADQIFDGDECMLQDICTSQAGGNGKNCESSNLVEAGTQIRSDPGNNLRRHVEEMLGSGDNDCRHHFRDRLRGVEGGKSNGMVMRNLQQSVSSTLGQRARYHSTSSSVHTMHQAGNALSMMDKREIASDHLLDVYLWQKNSTKILHTTSVDGGDDCHLDTAMSDPLVSSQLKEGWCGRSFSADGRLQSAKEHRLAESVHDERIGWFPGKLLRQFRNRNNEDCADSDDDSGNSDKLGARYNDQKLEGLSSSSHSSSSIDFDSEQRSGRSDSWYLGKYVQRLVASNREEDDSDSWYFGKYMRKVIRPASLTKSGGIMNHRDSCRLTEESLRCIQDNILRLEKSSDADSSSSSDSDDFEGIHRRHIAKRLPRLPPIGWLLGRSVDRFDIPIYPVEVYVKVESCRGLRSDSLLPPYSPVSLVEVSLGDNAPVRTEDSARTSNPVYLEKAIKFDLRYTDTFDEFILFTVYERFALTGKLVVLGKAELSLAALPVHADCTQPVAVTMPLLRDVPRDKVGKGIYCPESAVAASLWQTKSGFRSYDEAKRDSIKARTSFGGGILPIPTGGDDENPATINASVIKIDKTMFCLLRQLKAEDDIASGTLQQEETHRWLDEEDCFVDGLVS